LSLIYNKVVIEDADSYKINVEKIKELPHTEAVLYELLHGFGFTKWDDVSKLLYAQTGKQIFSKTHSLLKNREELILSKVSKKNYSDEFSVGEEGISKPIQLTIEPSKYIGETEKNIIYVASEKLHFPLKLRNWKKGDSFHPFGMTGKKKVSKFFKDIKIPLNEKEKIWLLLSDETIVWIIGHRMDDRFKVTQGTSQILKLTFNEETI